MAARERPALIGLVMRSRMPESPRWLLRHGKYDQVRDAMATLGVQDVSEDDVRRAAEVVEQAEGGSREKRRRAWTPGVRRALIVVSVFFIFQQITGINVPSCSSGSSCRRPRNCRSRRSSGSSRSSSGTRYCTRWPERRARPAAGSSGGI